VVSTFRIGTGKNGDAAVCHRTPLTKAVGRRINGRKTTFLAGISP
jgi:hypothetical protein